MRSYRGGGKERKVFWCPETSLQMCLTTVMAFSKASGALAREELEGGGLRVEVEGHSRR